MTEIGDQTELTLSPEDDLSLPLKFLKCRSRLSAPSGRTFSGTKKGVDGKFRREVPLTISVAV